LDAPALPFTQSAGLIGGSPIPPFLVCSNVVAPNAWVHSRQMSWTMSPIPPIRVFFMLMVFMVLSSPTNGDPGFADERQKPVP